MRHWTAVDEHLALELQNYVSKVKRRASKPWRITDKNAPWTKYYAETSVILAELRTLRLVERGQE